MLGPDDLVFCSVPVSHVPLFDRLEPVKAAGFAGISVGVAEVHALRRKGVSFADTARRIADSGLAVADMECVGNWLPGQDFTGTGYDEMMPGLTPEAGLEAAVAVGSPNLLVVEMSNTPVDFDTAVRRFADICDAAAPHGIISHLEQVQFGGIKTFAKARAIVEAADRPNGKLTLDPFHFYRNGGQLSELESLAGTRISIIQLCDALLAPQGDPASEMVLGRELPGQGEFDLVRMMQIIEGNGYHGPVGIEVFNARQLDESMAQIASDWAASARAVIAKARGTKG